MNTSIFISEEIEYAKNQYHIDYVEVNKKGETIVKSESFATSQEADARHKEISDMVESVRYVYSDWTHHWHPVLPDDMDYCHGFTGEEMTRMGSEAAKAKYLAPSLI